MLSKDLVSMDYYLLSWRSYYSHKFYWKQSVLLMQMVNLEEFVMMNSLHRLMQMVLLLPTKKIDFLNIYKKIIEFNLTYTCRIRIDKQCLTNPYWWNIIIFDAHSNPLVNRIKRERIKKIFFFLFVFFIYIFRTICLIRWIRHNNTSKTNDDRTLCGITWCYKTIIYNSTKINTCVIILN